VKANDFVEIVGGGLPVLNKRFQVAAITGPEETSRILQINMTSNPGTPTSPMRTFKSFAETMPAISVTQYSGQTVTVLTERRHNRVGLTQSSRTKRHRGHERERDAE
jgi:hypothetical protein